MRRWIATLAAALALVAAATAGAWTAPDVVRIPPLKEREQPPPAVFSHWGHSQYACYACHPSIFPQEAVGFTHRDMDEGRACAACHNGEQAWPVRGTKCGVCHEP